MKTTKIELIFEIIFEIILPAILIILCITEVILYSVIHQWLSAALYFCCSGIWTATLTFNIQSLKLEKRNKKLERIIEEVEKNA